MRIFPFLYPLMTILLKLRHPFFTALFLNFLLLLFQNLRLSWFFRFISQLISLEMPYCPQINGILAVFSRIPLRFLSLKRPMSQFSSVAWYKIEIWLRFLHQVSIYQNCLYLWKPYSTVKRLKSMKKVSTCYAIMVFMQCQTRGPKNWFIL